MDIDYGAIGLRIRAARKRKGYTQEKMAEMTGMSSQHLSNIENAKTKLSLPVIIAIANCLDVTVDSLLCDVINRSEVVLASELQEIFDACDKEQKRLVIQIVKSSSQALQQLKKNYLKQQDM